MIRTYFDGERLPVNPLDEVTLKIKGNNQQFEIVTLGDVTKLGNRKLIGLELKSLFTDHDYPWSTPSPVDGCVSRIQRIMDSKRTARLVIAGDGVDINLLCTIDSFSPSRHYGETDECYYTLSLTEYRHYSAKRIRVVQTKLQKSAPKPAAQRQGGKPKAQSYTVKDGDCLWNIAKQVYGSGAQYKKIYEANRGKISNPNLIYTGQQLVLP